MPQTLLSENFTINVKLVPSMLALFKSRQMAQAPLAVAQEERVDFDDEIDPPTSDVFSVKL